ncbi:baculoviral IAP repeat-containing protein 7-B-like isoform X2 [Atheta coriaria]|uniref:baculoviral IAP repeat-containing protein 7-B-like isoform X2 n=1 Tax=Dalotia coriaria TaxID=877792 RepID=UPI0031F3DBB9
MNVEENRLQTFADWPSDAQVNPIRIAKAGFFYTKANITVECFACHLRIWEWSYGDQAMAKHQQLSPECPFVKDPSTSGNVPNISMPTNSQTNEPREDLLDEAARLRTFATWPATNIVTPESLARAGFFYLRHNDLTKCAFCGGIVGTWEPGDDPDREHTRHFPDCAFVVSTIEPRLEGSSSVRDGNLAALGVNTHKGPKKPKYGTMEARLTTFANWPSDLVQTPEQLAQSGFYYEGSGDQVRCFHCDGGLKHWDPHDEPWTEHARWFPHCGFVALLKGQDFITACAPELDAASVKELQAASRRTAQHRKEITERDVQTHMLSAPARAALDVGLQVDRVKQAIRDKLERTGAGFSTGDALIEATLNLQRDEDENGDDHISRSVTNMLNDVISSLNEPGTPTKSTAKPQTSIPQPQVRKTSPDGQLPADARPTRKLSLEEENRLLKEARLCKICMDCEVGIVFLPCGHLATCINCAPNLQDCPVCRSAIKATVRTFLS